MLGRTAAKSLMKRLYETNGAGAGEGTGTGEDSGADCTLQCIEKRKKFRDKTLKEEELLSAQLETRAVR